MTIAPSLSHPTPANNRVATLYVENHAWLRNWLAYRLRSWGRGVADDLAHDVFLRILLSPDARQPEPIRQPRAYLTKIANCVLVSWRRRQSLELAWLDALATLPEPQQPSPEQQSVILESLHEIDALLDTLKPRIRQAFLMATLDGMKQKDIAAALNIALPTVKKYIHAAYVTCLSLLPDE
ncbi:RNA polymerase subunit sigma [Pseudomonas sp. SDI]|uniref:sigma-70 family RNA polymerase sigma factor n=1 Tax=Pseudomonas sp. SDI TaxID=2170734 RepID=UPI000DE63A8C|nr:sigma-70 family RNA polymerase sigma factor [Pseudomonas sp. SDI]PWB31975.1 RNA polymerase subunit sigma [Pseudomonas sp. SDI]